MTTITVLRPVAVRPPRAAAWAARAFLQLLSWFEAAAERRAERQRATDRALEAANLRAYAAEVEIRDPSFAADLRAAADRHQCGA
jgi:hypothetical protein